MLPLEDMSIDLAVAGRGQGGAGAAARVRVAGFLLACSNVFADTENATSGRRRGRAGLPHGSLGDILAVMVNCFG